MQDCRVVGDIIELSFIVKLNYKPDGFKYIVKDKILSDESKEIYKGKTTMKMPWKFMYKVPERLKSIFAYVNDVSNFPPSDLVQKIDRRRIFLSVSVGKTENKERVSKNRNCRHPDRL